ncbi:hypothetical protein, partial [Streptococcus pneumoniae]|uniref:hypothetical protein n=1 Tax=Streptococcus pneumoniae TaxID=1313 RepID=UPI001E5654CA
QRARIEDIRGGMEDFRATDTPDMIRVKQEMLKNFQEMSELQPQVSAAYRRAAEQLARDAGERGVPAPVEIHHPEPEQLPPATPAPAPGHV